MSRQRMALWAALGAVVVGGVAGVVAFSGDDSALKPLPLVAGAGSAAAEASSVAASPAMDSRMGLWAPITYTAGDSLPTLGGTGMVYRVVTGTDSMLRDVAGALGVDGAVQIDRDRRFIEAGDLVIETYEGTFWSAYRNRDEAATGVVVEPDCGDADCAASSEGSVEPGTPGPAAEPCGPDETCERPPPIEEYHEPEPDPDLPTEAEARSIAESFFSALGVDSTDMTLQHGYAEWWVNLEAPTSAGKVSGLGYGMGIGPDGVVQYANGWSGEIESVGEYPLVDRDEAIRRLNEGWYGPGTGGAEPTIAVDGGPEPMMVDDVAAQSDSPGDQDAGAEPPPDETVDEPVGPPDECDPARCDPVMEEFEQPERQEVTLTNVETILSVFWSWDGSGAYLVPTYHFSDDNGEHLVDSVALTDDAFGTPPEDQGEVRPIEGGSSGSGSSGSGSAESGPEPLPAEEAPVPDPAG